MEQYKDRNWLHERYYDDQMSLDEIATLSGCCQRTVVNWMNRFSMKRRDSHWKTEHALYHDREWLYQRYWNDEMTQDQIASLCHTTQERICSWIKHFNIPTRQGKRVLYRTNYALFKQWSHDSAYILGLIATDGSIDARQKTIMFRSADYELAAAVHSILGTDPSRPIFEDYNGTKGPYYRVLISSTEVVRDLVAMNITPNKSHTLKWLNVPPEYLSSFVSGVLDGDGCVTCMKRLRSSTLRLSARFAMTAELFMNGLVSSLRDFIGVSGSYTSRTQKDGWHAAYCFWMETMDSLKFLDWIYSSPCPHLQRKKAVYLHYLSWAIDNLNGSARSYKWRDLVMACHSRMFPS